tara:strand:+ start:469 stop:849 length:381 start_codon:yes stop_codon:yes gene_type:complete
MDAGKIIVKTFLNKCSINFKNFDELHNMEIPRDALLNKSIYNEIKEEINTLKVLYSSGSLTCLQKNAELKQKWPLLNLVRQILKSNNFQMFPIRRANGYTKEGKKLYKRFFIIKKSENEIKQDLSE